MAEVGQAYVQIIPSTKGFSKAIENQISGVTNSASRSITSSLSSAFGTVAKVGVSAVGAIGGAVMGVAGVGGISRALKIDEATFKFQQMGLDVEATMASCNEAVSGTAYGLDAAATVAASLGASGVQAGDEMTNSLKAVAGMAAMSGRSMEDVGLIFGKVAAQGRLQGDELMQFAENGVNATAALANYLGKTQAEVREMVSAGEVDFQTFNDAMYATFGDAAQGANATFSGAMSNVTAALSRVGAKFADPALDGLRRVFVAAIPAIDGVSKALQPAVDAFTIFCDQVASRAVVALEDFNTTLEETGNVWQAFTSMLSTGIEGTLLGGLVSKAIDFKAAVEMGVDPVVLLKAYVQDFADSASNAFQGLLDKFPALSNFLSSVDFSSVGKEAAVIGSVAVGLGLVAPAASKAIGAITAVAPKISSVVGALKGIPSTAALLGQSIGAVFTGWPPSGVLGTIKSLGGLFTGLVSPIGLVVAAIAALAAGFVYCMSTDAEFANGVMQLIGQVGSSLAPIIQVVATQLMQLAATCLPLIMTAVQTLLPVLGQIVMVILQVVTAIAPLVTTLLSILIPVLAQIITIVVQVVAAVITAVMPVISTIVSAISSAMPTIMSIIQSVMGVIQSIFETVWPVVSGLVTGTMSVIQGIISAVMPIIQGIISAVMSLIQGDWDGAWQSIQGVLSAAWDAIGNAVSVGIDGVLNFFSNLPGNILSALGDLGSLLFDAGSNIIQGLIDGISSLAGNVVDTITNVVSGAVDGVKDFLGIASPSKLFAEIGLFTMAGMANGIASGAGIAERSMQQAVAGVSDAANVNPSKYRFDAPDGGFGFHGDGGGGDFGQIFNIYANDPNLVAAVVADKQYQKMRGAFA